MVAFAYDPPSERDSEIAREASAKIIPFVRQTQQMNLVCQGRAQEEQIALPAIAIPLFQRILETLAAGHAVTIIPQHAELTTMEAADILNVSRPYLVKLLEAGEIPFHRVGRHRRVRMEHLMAYKEKSERQSRAAMDELVALSEELGLYDL